MKNLIIVLCLFFVMNLSATIINIPADQPTIQAGLDIAIEGDSVIVAEGIYFENLTWPDINGIKLIGSSENNCIIDGNSTGSVIYYECWNTIHDSTTVIKNFTIQNGYWPRGAGINLRSENQFLLENLIVKDNYQYLPLESDISNDERYCIEGGAGIHLDNLSSPIIRNVQIINNYSEFDGGGLFIYEHSEPLLKNVLIANNYSSTSGGGIACECWSDISLNNVTIVNNVASENGGGVFIYGGGDSSSVQTTNSIFWDNLPEEIYFDELGSNNNSITISYSDIQGGEEGIITNGNGIVNWLEGNIDDYPMFVDPLNNDYHLTENSPCIDAGNPNFPFDPDGTISDMGAFYFDQLSSINDNEIQFVEYNLSNFPNPFNPTTTIKFSIQNNSKVYLSIFNIKGQKIKTLANNDFTKGNHSIIWDGVDDSGKPVSSGIYLYSLKVNGKSVTMKKCLLLK